MFVSHQFYWWCITKYRNWLDLIADLQITPLELKELLLINYDLDEDVVDGPEFFYNTKIGKKDNKKKVVLDDDIIMSILLIRRHNGTDLPKSVLLKSDINVCVR